MAQCVVSLDMTFDLHLLLMTQPEGSAYVDGNTQDRGVCHRALSSPEKSHFNKHIFYDIHRLNPFYLIDNFLLFMPSLA